MRVIGVLTASLALAFTLQPTNQDEFTLSDGQKCGLEGTAQSAAGKELNRHKNRSAAPEEEKIDAEVSLTAMLAPGKDFNRFDAEKGARLTGFVVDVKPGGKGESCNCKATTPTDMDTHIEVGLGEDAPEIQRVIVEVTPRLRKLMKDKGGEDTDWSTATLRSRLKGKWVEFTGWLMFDSMHIDGAENTNPGGSMNWRVTCWEVHPVTAIKVLDSPPPVAASFQPALAAFHKAHAQQITMNPKVKEAIAKRNEAFLKSRFHPGELAEKEEEVKGRKPDNP